jgi:hypothetical protein
MKSGALFKSNTSQAIRLPKDVACPNQSRGWTSFRLVVVV